MRCEVRSKVYVKNCFSDSFNINVGVHQSSALSPLLFIKALPQEFRTGYQWELKAGNLAIFAESVEELCRQLPAWKVKLEIKGSKLNMKKTKAWFSEVNMDTLINSGVRPSAVYYSAVRSNTIHYWGASIGCTKSAVKIVAN